MLKTINVGTKKKIRLSTYDTDWIKNRCFICGKEFQNTEKDYEIKGNCCTECNVRIDEKIQRDVRERARQRKYYVEVTKKKNKLKK